VKIDARKLRSLLQSRGLTNKKLAAQAGISRQALQGFLKTEGIIEVRDKTVKGLAEALRLPDNSVLSPDPLVGYKDAVANEHADLAFRGLGLPAEESKPLSELFVPIRVTQVSNREFDPDSQPPTVEEEEPSEKIAFMQTLTLFRRILLQGEPGSGKTTALRHAARTCAHGLPADCCLPKQARVPLLVRLADFAKARERDDDLSLVRFVVTRVLRECSPEFWREVENHLEKELERGACIVLLDGLDEVGPDKQFSVVLSKFIDRYPHNQFVLTSRIVGLDAGPWQQLGFSLFEISRWDESDIREFAHRWYSARPVDCGKLHRKQQAQRAEELTDAILSHQPLRAIASNPLMLTILAALHYANAALPRRRVDIYAKIVEVMLETWEASKRDARSGDPLHGIVLDAREFRWLLERLALEMQRDGRMLWPRWGVSDFVQQFLREQLAFAGDQVKEQGEQVIRYLSERTGLFVERGDCMFGFSHRSFQEYFAARGLLLEVEGGGDIVGLLRPYLFHPQWAEVVVHVAASLSAPRATTLLRVILDDPDPAGRFLRRSQQLALRCLVDGATIADRTLLEQLFSDGETVGGSRWLGIAMRLISLLKQLRGTRHEAEAERMLRDIDDGARQQLPANEYIAVYCWSHDLPDGLFRGAPGKIYKKRLGRRQVELISTAWKKRVEDPEAWFADVLQSLGDPKTELKSRIVLISLLGDEADSNEKARCTLEKLLVRDREPEVRASCAEALEGMVKTSPRVANLLLRRLQQDRSEDVRERCAQALRWVAPENAVVRDQLKELLTSATEKVRAGAAAGLSLLDFNSSAERPLLKQFLGMIASSDEASRVRSACLWAISNLIGKKGMTVVDQAVEKCLDDDEPNVQKTALHVLADAIADGRKEWFQALVEKVETMLMAVQRPCAHLLYDLLAIVETREIRGGRRLELLLCNALTSVGDRIILAFVFGSVAREEQVRDSDVDLMVIGDVRLKELASALHSVEQTIGRTVNPVLFSPDKFRDQYREGNPFLLDVVRKEKIFLKGGRDELTTLVADRSVD
jgi:predicted nucleotidyltransferase/HEAT repeat protein/transcriptional regulator with XRE-family HTH domain